MSSNFFYFILKRCLILKYLITQSKRVHRSRDCWGDRFLWFFWVIFQVQVNNFFVERCWTTGPIYSYTWRSPLPNHTMRMLRSLALKKLWTTENWSFSEKIGSSRTFWRKMNFFYKLHIKTREMIYRSFWYYFQGRRWFCVGGKRKKLQEIRK